MTSKIEPGENALALELHQALACHSAGELGEAETLYRSILEKDSEQPDALHLLGVIAHQRGDYKEAARLISTAVQHAPDYAEAHLNLGNTLKALNHGAKAIDSFRRAVRLKPDFAEAYCNLGNALIDNGDLDEALAHCHKAILLKPDLADAHNNLGNAYRLKGELKDALSAYQSAVSADPHHADSHFNLGLTYREIGDLDAEFSAYREATRYAPHCDLFWDALASSLEMLSFSSADAKLWQDLDALITKASIRTEPLIRPVLSALIHHPVCAEQLATTEARLSPFELRSAAAALSDISLLLRLMSSNIINDTAIEGMLAQLRRAMLLERNTLTTEPKALPFAAAMALYCFTNEYALTETTAETEAVKALETEIGARICGGQQLDKLFLSVLAAYRPLHTYPWAPALSDMTWCTALEPIVIRQINEPLEEKELDHGIKALTLIDDGVSSAVREQYEQNPYPRWSSGIFNNAPMKIEAYLRTPSIRIELGDYVSPERPSVLIAGCGTGQHALVAAKRYASASLTAIDLSRRSLAYGKRMSKNFGIDNINFRQADILNLGDQGLAFDIIECCGTLHHMADPVAGWRALISVLRPQGLMKIALYSETARQQVVRARAMIAERKYGATPQDIRRCRQDIIDAVKAGDTGFAQLLDFNDFYSLSGCRDLLFHVQEHRFTLLQIEEILASLDLRFLGFEIGHSRIVEQFREANPTPEAWTSLQTWHMFEQQNPDTFGAMYQFWCQKEAEA